MKKVLWMLVAAALTITACQKPQYIIPIDDDEEEEKPGEQEAGFKEKTFVVNVTFQNGVNTTYEGQVVEMPGNEILDFLGLTAQEFYKGFGTISGSGSGGESDLQRSQQGNTIMFGLANANNTDDLKWIPASSGDCGQWFTNNGTVTYWSDDASWFFIENHNTWGQDSPDADALAEMWKWTIGFRPDHYDGTLTTYKATQVFFYTDDSDVERYAYVQWNLTVEEAEEVQLNVVKTQEINLTAAFENNYASHALVPEIDTEALKAAIGVAFDEADVYGVNADGSFSLAPGKNFWYNIAGDIIGWQSTGGENGICINDDNRTNDWAWCMYPYDGLAGQTCYGAIAFVNPTTKNAYLVKLSVAVGAQDTWGDSATIQIGGDAVETYPDFAPLATYLGFEDVGGLYDALCDGSVYPVGVNADGSLFLGEDGNPAYSQASWYDEAWGTYARGVFFSKDGFGSYWSSGNDNFYSTMYWYKDGDNKVIEIDVNPFDGLTEEDLGYYTYKWGFVKGEKMGCIELQITLESAIPWNSVTVDGMTANIKMVPQGGYKGLMVTFDNATIAQNLGTENLAAEIESGDIVVVGLNADGSVAMNPNDNTKYWNSGETPFGHWFGADNNVCGYGEDARICCNIKTDGTSVYTAMCQIDWGGPLCAVGDSYKLVQRFMKGDKSVDVTYVISIVESI